MANFVLRRHGRRAILGPDPDGLVLGCWNREPEGMSATELVERPLCWNAPLFGEPRPFPNVAYRRQP
jgi:hypothetical protein